MSSPVFIGLDLAWSDRNRTGGAVICNGVLVASTGLLSDDASIEAFIAEHLPEGAPAVVAVDAPLRVPNHRGRRRADHEVSLAWGKFDAGAYPANRALLARNGAVRGEVLVERLHHRFGCIETAPIPQRGVGRYICEVFPHPAHIVLFDLPRTLKYKRKSGRTQEAVAAEFAHYQRLLTTLIAADPPLTGLDTVTAIDASQCRGQALQEMEETLDAITCAYVAYYAWHHGPARQRVYGSVAEGHTLVPLPPQTSNDALANAPPAAVATARTPPPALPPDTLNARIGVLTRREVEARILAPVIDALGREFGRDEVIAVVRETIIRIAQEQGAQLAETMGGDSLAVFADSLRFWTQDNALEIDVLAQDEQRFDFNVTRCRYAELYRALDIPELGAVLSCNRDWALIQGFNPEVELTRTQTIMQGASFCDFRYRRQSAERQQPNPTPTEPETR
jgi:predicted RNase H-like nuclease